MLAEQFARPFIPARLDQQIEDFALLVDGAPQVIRLAAIRTTISSRCHLSPGRGRRWRRPRAIAVLSRHLCSAAALLVFGRW